MKKDTIGKIVLCVVVFVFFAVYGHNLYEKDSTDPPSGRSGLGLQIDHMTGCHYLITLFGGITPRLDADGQHVCIGDAP